MNVSTVKRVFISLLWVNPSMMSGNSLPEFLTLMVDYHPRKLTGPWKAGYVLDLHTTSSILVGHNEFGHAQFETTYSEIGSLLNRLKYHNDKSALPALVETAVSFL